MKVSNDIQPKPPGYLTVSQWAKLGRRPISPSCVKQYYATREDGKIVTDYKTKKPFVYGYVAPEDTEEIPKNEITNISISTPGKIICFDTETTGCSKWDEIIQISIFEMDASSLEITEVLSTFVKPLNKKRWDSAEAVNGISPQDVANAPTIKDLRPQLASIFSSAETIVGHNVGFDIRMLAQCARIRIDKNKVADTLSLFRADVRQGHHKLADAVAHYIPEDLEWFQQGAHKADTDTEATLKVYRAIISKNREIADEYDRN